MSELVDRLRGIYRVKITDGLGPVEGSADPNDPDHFVRVFETTPISKEAADRIEALENQLRALVEWSLTVETKHGLDGLLDEMARAEELLEG